MITTSTVSVSLWVWRLSRCARPPREAKLINVILQYKIMKSFLALLLVVVMMQSAVALEVSKPERIFYGTTEVPVFLREPGADILNYSINDGPWVVGCVDCDVFNGAIRAPN